MMKKVHSLLLVIALIFAMAVPASAAEDSNWIELLETTTVNDSGVNWFSYSTSATISIPTPRQMRVVAVDMLLSYTNGTAPDSVEFISGGYITKLTVSQLTNGMARVYGVITNTFYTDVQFRFTRSANTTSTVEVLSCRINSLPYQNFDASADVLLGNAYYPVNDIIDLAGHGLPNANVSEQIRISVYDWQKYDTLSIMGYFDDAAISSIRASIGSVAIDVDVSFIDTESAGGWIKWENDENDGDGTITDWYSEYLFSISVDVSDLRAFYTEPLYLYVTCDYDMAFGATFICQYVTGSVLVPDISDLTWWQRFTSFMTDLFGGEDPAADDFASNMESQATEAEDLIDELEQVTKPPVGDIDVDLSDVVSGADVSNAASPLTALLSNELFFSMTMISLTLALVAYVLYGKR